MPERLHVYIPPPRESDIPGEFIAQRGSDLVLRRCREHDSDQFICAATAVVPAGLTRGGASIVGAATVGPTTRTYRTAAH